MQEQLGGYSHVNRKALDQYVNFTEQREELHRRRTEVMQGGEWGGGLRVSGVTRRWQLSALQ